MRGPNRLEAAPFEVIRLMTEIQDWTVADIARRIAKSGVITSSAEFQLTRLREMQDFDKNLKKIVQEKLEESNIKIENLYKEAAKADYIYDKRLFTKKGIPFIPFDENIFMQNLTASIIAQTKNEFKNITQSLGFAEKTPDGLLFKPVAKFYQDTLDQANLQVSTGVSDINTVLKRAVETMANSGLRTVDYASGWSNRIDVAVRRAVMCSMRDLVNRQSERNAQELGLTCFEISWHSGHRPSHGWGGRRYDTTGIHYLTPEKLFEKYGGGTPQDYYCYHEVYAVDPDSEPNYTDAQLDKMEAEEKQTKTYEGIEYTKHEAKQQQRKIERALRTTRLKAKGYEASRQFHEYDVTMTLYQRQRQIYTEFSKAMGLQTEYDRVYVDGLGKLKKSIVNI